MRILPFTYLIEKNRKKDGRSGTGKYRKKGEPKKIMGKKNNKDRVILVRCSEREIRRINELSRKNHQTRSAYVRNCALHGTAREQPVEIMDVLKDLDYLNRKIGNNINQIVKASHARGFVMKEDTDALSRLLTRLDESYERVYRKLVRKRHGNHKAVETEGTKIGQPGRASEK